MSVLPSLSLSLWLGVSSLLFGLWELKKKTVWVFLTCLGRESIWWTRILMWPCFMAYPYTWVQPCSWWCSSVWHRPWRCPCCSLPPLIVCWASWCDKGPLFWSSQQHNYCCGVSWCSLVLGGVTIFGGKLVVGPLNRFPRLYLVFHPGVKGGGKIREISLNIQCFNLFIRVKSIYKLERWAYN